MFLRETARRLTRAAWLERRLFEIVGQWSADCPDADVARLFAVQSPHHAWRAALLEEHIPVLHDVPAEELAPSASLVAFTDAVAASTGTLERLAGLTRVVLPELLGSYEEHLTLATEVADAPVLRVLRLVVIDEQDDWRVAVTVLRSKLRAERDVVGVATHQSQLEGLLLEAD